MNENEANLLALSPAGQYRLARNFGSAVLRQLLLAGDAALQSAAPSQFHGERVFLWRLWVGDLTRGELHHHVSVLIWIARALRTISGHADSIARTDSPRKFGTGPNLITTGERLGLTLALDTPIMGGVVEKLKPHYRLADIKAAFADPAKLNRTFSSKQGADALNMDDEAVVAVIQALAGSDFDKSMTSNVDHRIWQDVYRPKFGSTQLYVKFTLDAMNALLLISFKEA